MIAPRLPDLRRVRRSSLALVMVLLGIALAPTPGRPAHASCAGPSLQLARPVLHRGTSATVEGENFVDGCSDSGSCTTIGCASHCDDPEPETPLDDVELRVVQHGRSWRVGVADAGTAGDDRLGRVSWRFVVPRGLAPGPAMLRTEASGPIRVRIR